jgi:hypothetical protein
MMKDDKLDVLVQALRQIAAWSEAYPETVFPPIDLEKAPALLAAGGMTLDAVSADAVRHVGSTTISTASQLAVPICAGVQCDLSSFVHSPDSHGAEAAGVSTNESKYQIWCHYKFAAAQKEAAMNNRSSFIARGRETGI